MHPFNLLAGKQLHGDAGIPSKIAVYAQKGKCVTFYEKVLSDSSVSRKEGNEYVLFNETIMSALDMTMDIIRFWDKLYMMFQEIYNKAGGRFWQHQGLQVAKIEE